MNSDFQSDVFDKRATDYFYVFISFTQKALLFVVQEQVDTENDQGDAIRRENFLPALIIDSPLLSAWYAAASQFVWFVEEENGFIVLPLMKFNYETERLVVGINRQPLSTIASKKVESMLARSLMAKNLVAKIDDVAFILGAHEAKRFS